MTEKTLTTSLKWLLGLWLAAVTVAGMLTRRSLRRFRLPWKRPRRQRVFFGQFLLLICVCCLLANRPGHRDPHLCKYGVGS